MLCAQRYGVSKGGESTAEEDDTSTSVASSSNKLPPAPQRLPRARTKDFGLTGEKLAKVEEVGFLSNAWM